MNSYTRQILRVSVAQICQTIGYNSIQSIPLELLIDSLHKFLQEFARDLHRYVELFNRTEANLDDVDLSLQSLNISIVDLLEYINHVQPPGCGLDIPELPARKWSNLNFLKPGSKEVLTRPVHIYEYLPPMLRDHGDFEDKSNIATELPPQKSITVSATIDNNGPKENGEDFGKNSIDYNNAGIALSENKNSSHLLLEAKQSSILDSTSTSINTVISSSATREISSVMMTSGGFISPAIEGRMPQCLIPEVVDKYFGLDAPSATLPPSSVFSHIPVPTLKPQMQSCATSINPAMSPVPLRTVFKCDETKIGQTVDKRQKKKIKKKCLSDITSSIVTSSPLNDKSQRKRIKMLQKSMSKSTANTATGIYKTKSGSRLGQEKYLKSHDKFLKKQYKLNQKQTRQYAQKQVEGTQLTANTNIKNAGNVLQDPSSLSSCLLEQDQSSLKTKTPNTFITPLNLPSSKEIHYHPMADTINAKVQPQGQAPQVFENEPLSLKCDDVKLSNEPDRSKLNIFKKISSSGRKERADAAAAMTHPLQASILTNTDASTPPSNTTIFGDDQVISLPSGTTITPAPPSGSGRHVYAPPPCPKSKDLSSLISVDDDGSIPEGSAMLMQRGDLLIHKPKKRGRKPGSKNQPKIIGLPNKKGKKLKKSIYAAHPTSSVLSPLNLSQNSIANIANLPLGIASTFPIVPEVTLKMRKERKRAKMGKEKNFICNSGKSQRNFTPTKEEFASINHKLMMMDTVLQAAPPLPISNSRLTIKGGQTRSPLGPAGSFSMDHNSDVRIKKDKKKKQAGDIKHTLQKSAQSLPVNAQTNKSSRNLNNDRKSPSLYSGSNFANVPGISNLPMFPFYAFQARPGLIPSHNPFSQMPSMQNNSMYMPQLMGFRPLNPPIRSFLKDEKEPTPPLLQVGEGNYSKVAPLVPDTMKLELSPPSRVLTTSPAAPGHTFKNSSIIPTMAAKNVRLSPSYQGNTPPDTNTVSSISSTQGSTINLCDIRTKGDEHTPKAGNSFNCSENLSSHKASDVTIEVSSDDSLQEEICNKSLTTSHRSPLGIAAIATSISHRSVREFPANDFVNIEDHKACLIDYRSKDQKKLKKIVKQNKKQSNFGAQGEFKYASNKPETGTGVFDDEQHVVTNDLSSMESSSATVSKHTTGEDGSNDFERRKDHKKIKKLLRESKLKKKKEKKDKNKNKERCDKILKTDKLEKRKEDKKEKFKLKKLKKERKKEKTRSDMGGATNYASPGKVSISSKDTLTVIPKLTLKLGQTSQSPTPPEAIEFRKNHLNTSQTNYTDGSLLCSTSTRELSPELARISPLVTRPPKQKSAADEVASSSTAGITNISTISTVFVAAHSMPSSRQTPSLTASLSVPVESFIDIDSNSGGPTSSMLPASATILGIGMPTSLNNTTAVSLVTPVATCNRSSTLTQSNVTGQNNQASNHNTTVNKYPPAVPLISETNRPSSYIDAEGNRVWICPACGKVDDGSAMIGCDGCDAWYHWVCVGIFVAPNDNEDWYCRVCIAKKRGLHGGDKKRKRNKKKNLSS